MLHGTGGTEMDLVPIAERISPGSSVLSVRGNVLENGMPRFFKRLSEGVFDEEDLKYRTEELREFIDEAADKYGFDRHNVLAIGYSNGANIAGSLLFHYENVLAGAILLHPMVPIRDIQLPEMPNLPVFIGAGRNDPICPPEETEELAEMLADKNADVTLHWENYGHQLTYAEIDAAANWFRKRFS
ncbi:carboxylesterase [Pradoshia eiseniae]|uniref:Carboxylesterase n=1 Tax=Pradoshia eiseniae TaxID=2064768 RepID=A0A2S7MZ92_9BACI|nr:carboxylesterase [Pradoshia eiseniae]